MNFITFPIVLWILSGFLLGLGVTSARGTETVLSIAPDESLILEEDVLKSLVTSDGTHWFCPAVCEICCNALNRVMPGTACGPKASEYSCEIGGRRIIPKTDTIPGFSYRKKLKETMNARPHH